MWTKIGIVSGCIAAVGVMIGGFVKYHVQFAQAGELSTLQQQVIATDIDFKGFALNMQAAQIRQRLWQIEDNYQCEKGEVTKMPEEARQEYRRLNAQLGVLERKIDLIEKAKLETKSGRE